MSSSLFAVDMEMGDGEGSPFADTGDTPLGVPELEAGLEASPASSVAKELFLDLAPMRLFFCLNFSSQLLLLSLKWLSEFPTVVAKNRAFSLIMESDSRPPCL